MTNKGQTIATTVQIPNSPNQPIKLMLMGTSGSAQVALGAAPYSRSQDRYTVLSSGPHEYEGDEGYFGEDAAREDGTTYVELTVEQVNQLPIWFRQKTASSLVKVGIVGVPYLI